MLELLFYTFNAVNVSLLMPTPCGVSLQEATAGRSGFGSQESAEKSGRNKNTCLPFYRPSSLLFEQNGCSLFLGRRLSTIHDASCARTSSNNCVICYITWYLCICNSVKMSLLFKWETKFSFSLTFITEMTSDFTFRSLDALKREALLHNRASFTLLEPGGPDIGEWPCCAIT